MSKYLLWILLTSLTKSPVLSALALLVGWWVLDHFTLGVLPNPFPHLARFRRAARLELQLTVNPHDRRARLELGELLVGKRRYARAVEILRPNLDAGDDDAATLFVIGTACLGAGQTQPGEKLLAHVLEVEPKFRAGEVDLVRGRFRLARGDVPAAKEALERLCQIRGGTVEGRVLLAEAFERSGDKAAASRLRDEAWREFAAAPRFKRKQERFFAWRAKPERPMAYGLVLVAALGLFIGWVQPQLAKVMPSPSSYGTSSYTSAEDEE